jgi:single-strand DNA-binding protein
MNRVILCGRLTKEPEIRTAQTGMKIASYTLAVDRKRAKDGEQSADFISCKVFDKGAAFTEEWLHQGTKIIVEGRIQTGSYTNRDGVKVFTTDVIVDSQEFAESKKSEQPAVAPKEKEDKVDDGFMNLGQSAEEDFGLPFN